MQVFKFGGASVKDAEGVRNLLTIVKRYSSEELLIVISAMGKTTNALENIATSYYRREEHTSELFEALKNQHFLIIQELFGEAAAPVIDEVSNAFIEVEWMLEDEPQDDFDFIYDQIVSVGELVSTKIVSIYLNQAGIKNRWIDARSFIQTDNTYREAKIDWEKTCPRIETELSPILKHELIITQGFIGNTSENFTTTLGREGSDFSAAIFAHCLNAENVTVWKDVPGILNADPKIFKDTIKIEELSYADAMEMTYFGATVIHPKTIKPLQNKDIPLLVKSFLDAESKGTIIKQGDVDVKVPVVIVKSNQTLLSLSCKDHSFISEEHLSFLFSVFSKHQVKINVMQLSAISFSVCFDFDEQKFDKLKSDIQLSYHYKYNQDLQLLTIRHADEESIKRHVQPERLILEQRSRHTAQFVLQRHTI